MADNSNRAYHIIEKIAALSSEACDIYEIVNDILDELKDVFELSAVRVFERQDNFFNFYYPYSTKCSSDIHFNSSINTEKEEIFGFFSIDSTYFLINGEENIKKHPLLKGYNYPIQSILILPIFYQKYLVGGFEFIDFEKEREWSENELNSLQTVLRILLQYMYSMNAFKFINDNSGQFDPVTGLIKFESFSGSLHEFINENKSSKLAAVCFDIHQFKFINEYHGYTRGNEILSGMAHILLSNYETSLVCRVHSDNYIYIYKFKDESTILSEVEKINSALISVMQERYPDLNLKLNTGVFIIKEDASAAEIYTYANIARKRSKSNGDFAAVLFDSSMMEHIRRNEALNNNFQSAIDNKNFVVYYQPKISCKNEKIVGGEALIRWITDEGKFVYPDQFIPLFEKNGNIIQLDYYVYKEVFSYIKKRLDNNQHIVPISMNVSRLHLKDNKLIDYITELFEEFKIPPEYVEFELTENIYMDDLSNAQKFLDFCRSINVFVSIDDFGSGFSSLNVMNSLPIDILKIDKVFLKNDDLTDNDKIVIECIVSMAKKLKMKVVCEGVETQSQRDFLRDINCDVIQGFFYSKPVNEEEFNKYIDAHF